MKKKLLLLFFTQLVFSQAPTIQWQKCLGGSSNESMQSIFQTNDGGYIAAGNTLSTDGAAVGNYGNMDILIVKLDANGVSEWTKTYGGTSGDQIKKIIQTTDGGYIFSGFTWSNNNNVSGNHGGADVWVVKLNSLGNIVWQKTFGGTSADNGNSIIEIDNGYLIAAQTYSNNGNVTNNKGTTDAWLIKIDTLGNLIWQKTYGGSNFDSAVSVQQTTDGGFIFAGSTNSTNGDVTGNHNSLDFWIVKITNSGVIQWQKSLGGTSADEASSIIQTSDGGYVVTGKTSSNNGNVTNFKGNKDYWVVKLNTVGTIVWEKTFGGSNEDCAFKVIETSDGGLVVTGYTGSTDMDVLFNHSTNIPSLDIWVLKLNPSGTEIWQTSLGNSGYQDSFDIQQTTDGGFIIAGNSGGGNSGDVTGFLGGTDFWAVKLNAEVLNNTTFEQNKAFIYPNPTANILNLKYDEELINRVSIIDMNGRKIFFNAYNNKIDVSNLTSGIYIIEFKNSKNEIISRKMIKQ